MASTSTAQPLPTLPEYTLYPRPSLIDGIPDVALQMAMPILAYWIFSLFFHFLDQYDLCPQYRLHTPAEFLKRNHVTLSEVLREVFVQHLLQTATGVAFSYFDGPEMAGREEYDIASWALRLRWLQTKSPALLAILGIDSPKLASQINNNHPTLAAILAGGQYATQGFAGWEMTVAEAIYWYIAPFFQFVFGIIFVDAWQYFMHRGMHMNKYLYTAFHSRHHRLYVPYAFGALYNHPVEGFFMDTLGTGLASMATFMSVRQAMCFYTCTTLKTVDDHCGYAFPWDPLQHITSNNAAYHDIHHQSWGIKSNFSQPFFIFWDRWLGTMWTGGDISARYERAKLAAQKKVDADVTTDESSITNSPATDILNAKKQAAEGEQQIIDGSIDPPAQVLREEMQEEQEAQQTVRRNQRRKQSSFDAKSISDKVSGSLYGRRTPILHADGMH